MFICLTLLHASRWNNRRSSPPLTLNVVIYDLITRMQTFYWHATRHLQFLDEPWVQSSSFFITVFLFLTSFTLILTKLARGCLQKNCTVELNALLWFCFWEQFLLENKFQSIIAILAAKLLSCSLNVHGDIVYVLCCCLLLCLVSSVSALWLVEKAGCSTPVKWLAGKIAYRMTCLIRCWIGH